jgi:hypothetical protein
MNWDAVAVFEGELQRREIAFRRLEENVYVVESDNGDLTVSIENRRRDAERDDDPGALRRFVDDIVAAAREMGTPIVPWTEARDYVLLAVESSDQDFEDVLIRPLTQELSSIVTLTNAEHSRVTWVTDRMCADWGIQVSDVVAAARRNQDALLRGIELQVQQSGKFRLGLVPLDSPYKASVILAPSFRAWVEPHLGWPVYAVIPCRDFIYVFPQDQELLGRVGGVVVQEFKKSGYPLTTEVLSISDEGIAAIGKFPV